MADARSPPGAAKLTYVTCTAWERFCERAHSAPCGGEQGVAGAGGSLRSKRQRLTVQSNKAGKELQAGAAGCGGLCSRCGRTMSLKGGHAPLCYDIGTLGRTLCTEPCGLCVAFLNCNPASQIPDFKT
eukprot:6182162-Pleurochrysis_carterae.AAC.1